MSGVVAAKGLEGTRPDAARWPVHQAWVVAGLTGLAFALRLACLKQSLYGDELYLYEIVSGRSLDQVFSVVHDGENAALGLSPLLGIG